MQDPDPSDAEATASVGATFVYVCVTCRAEGEVTPPLEARAGLRLHDALLAELGPRSGISVVPVECLSVCRRPCTVSFAARGKWTYVYGDLPADGAAPIVAAAARLYAAAPDGLVPWKLRSDPIKKGVVSRVPPLPARSRGSVA